MGSDLRGLARRSHGLQLWAALPAADEETEPGFAHTPAAALPQLEVGGATVRVLIGSAFGESSPVAVRSPMLYLDIALAAGDAFPLPPAAERAIYVVDGAVTLDGDAVPPQTMRLLAAGDEPMLAADGSAPGAAAHVVEFRLVTPGAHRAGRRRLGGAAFGRRAGRNRIHPAARAAAGLSGRPTVRAGQRARRVSIVQGWRQVVAASCPWRA